MKESVQMNLKYAYVHGLFFVKITKKHFEYFYEVGHIPRILILQLFHES